MPRVRRWIKKFERAAGSFKIEEMHRERTFLPPSLSRRRRELARRRDPVDKAPPNFLYLPLANHRASCRRKLHEVRNKAISRVSMFQRTSSLDRGAARLLLKVGRQVSRRFTSLADYSKFAISGTFRFRKLVRFPTF